MRISKVLFATVSVFALHAYAKRGPAPVVKPLHRAGVEYSFEIEKLKKDCPDKKDGCGDRVFITAKGASGAGWKTEVYQVVYDSGLETDVQQILPKALRFKNKSGVELLDEKGKRYTVNVTNGSLISPKEVWVYSGP